METRHSSGNIQNLGYHKQHFHDVLMEVIIQGWIIEDLESQSNLAIIKVSLPQGLLHRPKGPKKIVKILSGYGKESTMDPSSTSLKRIMDLSQSKLFEHPEKISGLCYLLTVGCSELCGGAHGLISYCFPNLVIRSINVLFTDNECRILSPKSRLLIEDLGKQQGQLCKKIEKKGLSEQPLVVSLGHYLGPVSVEKFNIRESTAWWSLMTAANSVGWVIMEQSSRSLRLMEYCAMERIKRDFSCCWTLHSKWFVAIFGVSIDGSQKKDICWKVSTLNASVSVVFWGSKFTEASSKSNYGKSTAGVQKYKKKESFKNSYFKSKIKALLVALSKSKIELPQNISKHACFVVLVSQEDKKVFKPLQIKVGLSDCKKTASIQATTKVMGVMWTYRRQKRTKKMVWIMMKYLHSVASIDKLSKLLAFCIFHGLYCLSGWMIKSAFFYGNISQERSMIGGSHVYLNCSRPEHNASEGCVCCAMKFKSTP
ncbi:hypothetical protein Tco_0951751 [Tanacetum coccineum]|uniref:Uncharacterized protein n=1 Tax=Tanacetum coccineum TaxID=301880 RepID=A0ABQ5DXT7_9ASTR